MWLIHIFYTLTTIVHCRYFHICYVWNIYIYNNNIIFLMPAVVQSAPVQVLVQMNRAVCLLIFFFMKINSTVWKADVAFIYVFSCKWCFNYTTFKRRFNCSFLCFSRRRRSIIIGYMHILCSGILCFGSWLYAEFER